MDEAEFKKRTKQLALQTIAVADNLPRTRAGNVIGRQLIRSATSVGANYRAACRARSTADMIAKLGIVEEEADETMYWLELLQEAKLITMPQQLQEVHALHQEANEIVAMTVASIKTLRTRSKRK